MDRSQNRGRGMSHHNSRMQSRAEGERRDDEADAASDISADDGEMHSRYRTRSPETEIASLVSRALVGDLKLGAAPAKQESTGASGEESSASLVQKEAKPKEKVCCVCASPAIYTCPGCERRTCSITCVRVHKADHGCSGQRDVAAKIPLADFTDVHLQRDFHFLENCRRAVSNADRQLPYVRRINFNALPPALRALREAARRRGVVCQLMSEGMAKREANTSRYDRATNTIFWRCEFVFHRTGGDEDFRVSTNWGSERYHLGDIVRHCWATNPALPRFQIIQGYNHASRYLGLVTDATQGQAKGVHNEPSVGDEKSPDGGEDVGHDDNTNEGTAHSDDGSSDGSGNDEGGGDWKASEEEGDGSVENEDGASVPQHEEAEEGADLDVASSGDEHSASEGDSDNDDGSSVSNTSDQGRDGAAVTGMACEGRQLVAVGGDVATLAPPVHDESTPSNDVVPSPAPAAPEVVPLTPDEVRNEALVAQFLSVEGGWSILAKAERLGTEARYFLLDPQKTLNENMRLIFFVNEFPVFDVVHDDDLSSFPLVTDADKEAIRASFRAKERTPEELLRRKHPGVRLKGDLEPEELERLGKVPCRRHLMNRCVAGEYCPYWHCTLEEWPQCRSFEKSGTCPMGCRCSYRHGDNLPGEGPLPEEGANGMKRPRPFGAGRGGGRGGGMRGRGGGFRGGRGRGRRF